MNDEQKARLDAAFATKATPAERAGQDERKSAAARASDFLLMDYLFREQVRPEFEAVEKYLSERDVLCSVRQVVGDGPAGRSPSIAFCWGHIRQDWGRFIDHELRFEVDPKGSKSMVVRFAIVGGESGVIDMPDGFTKKWIADTLIDLVTKTLSTT